MSLLLKVPFFKQDTGYSCGPVSLQMVFRYFGVVRSEKTLMQEAGSDRVSGTSHQKMIELARKMGFYCYVNEDSSIEEIEFYLKKGVPVIVHFLEKSSDDSHYSVVVGIRDGRVILNDPWNGEGSSLQSENFVSRWHGGDLGSRRWMMVVSDKEFSIGKTYGPIC